MPKQYLDTNPFKNDIINSSVSSNTNTQSSPHKPKIYESKNPTINLFKDEDTNPFRDPYEKRQGKDSTSNEIKSKLPEISDIPNQQRKAPLLEVSKAFKDPLTSNFNTYYQLFGKNSVNFFVPIREEEVPFTGQESKDKEHID